MLRHRVFRIAAVLIPVITLFTSGISVATCPLNLCHKILGTALHGPETSTFSCNHTIVPSRSNFPHKMRGCKGTGLCYGFVSPAKTYVPFYLATAHTVDEPKFPMGLSASFMDLLRHLPSPPRYILNLSFLL